MYSVVSERERENRFKALKIVIIMMITAMMVIPIVQHLQNEYATVPVESYSYYNEMVKFIGQNAFVGFDGKMFPVSWTVFERNPNYSPGPQANPFSVSTNNTNTSAPLIEETFSNYSTNHIQSLWQNSAVMIKWNHYVRIAEIFSFTTKGIDASIVIKDLNVTGNYIGTFSMAMGYNSTACTNGFNPSYMNLSSGLGAIPSSDWNVTVGNLSLNWQSEDSIFSSGVISSGSSGDQIILPFNPGTINHNESYTIDPMIYYQPDRIIGGPISPIPQPRPIVNPNPYYTVYMRETGLSSGTTWQTTLNGQTKSSTSNTILFSEQDGTYSYTVGSVSGYNGPSPSSGSVSIQGGSRVVGITFTKIGPPPELGYLHVGCRQKFWSASIMHNLTTEIQNKSYTNYMVEGGLTSLNFSIPYYNATSGSSSITAYIQNGANNYMKINSTNSINGNGVWDFSWITQPGVYKGFSMKFTNAYGSFSNVYNDPFDVFSGLVTNDTQNTTSPCISDSVGQPSEVFNSNGLSLGYLVVTASGGSNGAYNDATLTCYGFQVSFISQYNNVKENIYKYGIFNYGQFINYTGSQNGFTRDGTTFQPINMNSQTDSYSSGSNGEYELEAEKAIWNFAEAGLALSGDPALMVTSVAMAALGPFLFGSSSTPGGSNFWGHKFTETNDFMFNNWINGAGNNMPPQTKACADYSPVAGSDPVYTIVNGGNGNASFMQNLLLNIRQPSISDIGCSDFALNYFTYSASATIVPITHQYYYGGGCQYLSQNDVVNATWVSTSISYEPWTWGNGYYKYSGPSYTAAASLPLYIPLVG
ncbi:MAG: hypothetical protein ACYDAO_07530 [Thermoplasmataceae archaeon]